MTPTASNINPILDGFVLEYLHTEGLTGQLYGFGESGTSWGVQNDIATARSAIVSSGDPLLQAAMLGGYSLSITNASGLKSAARIIRDRVSRLNALIKSNALAAGVSAVTDLDSYLLYLNTGSGGTWSALQDYNWYAIWNALKPALYPSVSNLYFEVLEGSLSVPNHLYTNGLGKFLVSGSGAGTFTKAVVEGLLVSDGSGGAMVDSTKYAGGFPYLNISGLTGTGNVTITADGISPAGSFTGKTFITSVTTGGSVAVTVGAGTAPTNALITHVTSVSVAAGISAGTIYVEAHRPSGRALLK